MGSPYPAPAPGEGVPLEPADFLSALERLALAGLPVLPCRADKSPFIAGGVHGASADARQAREWAARWPEALPGVATGPASGLFVVDCDVDKATGEAVGEATLKALGVDAAAHPFACQTRSGGVHLPYRWREGLPTSARRIGPGVDTRGAGGYVVAWDPGTLAAAAEAGDLPEVPEALARALAGPEPSPPAGDAPRERDATRERAYAARALEEAAAEVANAAPGERNDRLNRVAHRLGRFVGAGSLEEGEVAAALEEACRASGVWRDDGPKACRATIASGLRSGRARPHEGPATASGSPRAGGGGGQEWPREPDMSILEGGRRQVPPFPTELLGEGWRKWCEHKASAKSAPVDFVAATLFATAGALLANVRRPLAGATWCEPPVLWLGIVGSPSAGKSPAMDAVLEDGALAAAEDALGEGFEELRRENETAREAAKEAERLWKEEVKRAVAEGQAPPVRPPEADAPPPIERPRLAVRDATPERLACLAAGNARGLLIVRDELAAWAGGFGRYSGAASAERALALEAYGGRRHTVDRQSAPAVVIPHLALGVVGGTQPDRVTGILGEADDGLAARFLWCWPDVNPGFRLGRERDDDDGACEALSRLARLPMDAWPDGNPRPRRVRLTAEAEGAIEAFGAEMAREAHAAHGLMASHAGKARGHALRLALVLEYLWWAWRGGPEPHAVSLEAVRAAAGLVAGYFHPHAARVFGDAGTPARERAAAAVARHIRAHGLQRFNARELRRTIGGPVRQGEAMKAALEELAEAGLIRPAPERQGGGPGRKASGYIVHPTLSGVTRAGR